MLPLRNSSTIFAASLSSLIASPALTPMFFNSSKYFLARAWLSTTTSNLDPRTPYDCQCFTPFLKISTPMLVFNAVQSAAVGFSLDTSVIRVSWMCPFLLYDTLPLW